MDSSNLLLRFSIGSQDTVALSDYEKAEYFNMLWLCKLSIISFQKWFPHATFVLLYNGTAFSEFVDHINEIDLKFSSEVHFINQKDELREGRFTNPYHFWPQGVWWKWIPFRLDIEKDEIAIDTDIVCIGEPKSWYEWKDEPLVIDKWFNQPATEYTYDLALTAGEHRVRLEHFDAFQTAVARLRWEKLNDLGSGPQPRHVATTALPTPTTVGGTTTIETMIRNDGDAEPFIVDIEMFSGGTKAPYAARSGSVGYFLMAFSSSVLRD